MRQPNRPLGALLDRHAYAARMRSLPASALLCAWLDAVREGRAGPDDLEDAVRGHDPRHLVVGLRASLPAGRATAIAGHFAAPTDLD